MFDGERTAFWPTASVCGRASAGADGISGDLRRCVVSGSAEHPGGNERGLLMIVNLLRQR